MLNRRDAAGLRRKFGAACGLTCLAALLAGAVAAPPVPSFLHRYRLTFKSVRARMKGAQFAGESGVVMQSRENDCGVAALQMILIAHGVRCGAADLAGRLPLTARGTSMLALRHVSAQFGIPAKSWVIRPVDLHKIPLPAIALAFKDHFVVVRRFIEPEVLEIDDPALGRLRWPMRAFVRAWSGETLVFDPAWTPL